MIKDAELWFARLNPKYPNATFNPDNPTWEVQLRTSDITQRDLWKSQNLNVSLLTKRKEGADEDDPKVPQLTEDGKKIYKVNLQRRSLSKDGVKNSPVKVVNGQLEDVDTDTIGNGSIGNVTVFQYDYTNAKTKQEGVAAILKAIQITKHVVSVRGPSEDDFQPTKTIVIQPKPKEEAESTAPKAAGTTVPAGRKEDEF